MFPAIGSFCCLFERRMSRLHSRRSTTLRVRTTHHFRCSESSYFHNHQRIIICSSKVAGGSRQRIKESSDTTHPWKSFLVQIRRHLHYIHCIHYTKSWYVTCKIWTRSYKIVFALFTNKRKITFVLSLYKRCCYYFNQQLRVRNFSWIWYVNFNFRGKSMIFFFHIIQQILPVDTFKIFRLVSRPLPLSLPPPPLPLCKVQLSILVRNKKDSIFNEKLSAKNVSSVGEL